MPFYEYECPHCGYDEEVLQKINDKPLTKCPSCGKNGLRKLMSAPVFRLKGSGWYETDFKSDKENKRNLAAADKDEVKSDSKTEAKPDAAKPEAAKAEKSEAAKPAVEKASKSASKPAARKARPKAKPARSAKRPARR
ncbi:MAG TPA: zinc ribbon domain-containing protein [Steroidobacteraceae bacterium]|nr:zinc ribbon domain-containing protein [Steroidobacteraceae bacterium]